MKETLTASAPWFQVSALPSKAQLSIHAPLRIFGSTSDLGEIPSLVESALQMSRSSGLTLHVFEVTAFVCGIALRVVRLDPQGIQTEWVDYGDEEPAWWL